MMVGQKKYQEVFNIVDALGVGNWTQLVFFAHYDEGSFVMKLYAKSKTGKYVDLYATEQLREKITDAYIKIDKVLCQSQKEEGWKTITLIFEPTGKFNADYDYREIEGRFTDYLRSWKGKYLA